MIAILGPESTGKTELSEFLAKALNGAYHEELARQYIESIKRPYNIEDIDAILQLQKQQYNIADKSNVNLHFFDTEWIITKIWYEWVYKSLPIDFCKIVCNMHYDFYLLCKPDIPWQYDAVRENGGEARNKLFEIYEQELKYFGLPFAFVSDTGQKRQQNALNIIKNALNIP